MDEGKHKSEGNAEQAEKAAHEQAIKRLASLDVRGRRSMRSA